VLVDVDALHIEFSAKSFPSMSLSFFFFPLTEASLIFVFLIIVAMTYLKIPQASGIYTVKTLKFVSFKDTFVKVGEDGQPDGNAMTMCVHVLS